MQGTKETETQSNCRVNYPHTCEIKSLNKWGKDFSSYQTSPGVVGQKNGMYIYRPEDGLRVPQRRPFLSPEYYDGGCYQWYCPRKEVCPRGKLAGPSAQENDMFNYMFASTDPYENNNCMANCAGVKGISADSTCGWIMPPGQDKFVWQIEADKTGNVGSCSQPNNHN